MAKPLTITSLTRTCLAVPSQWEGETSDGAAVYLRYRGGVFRLHVGPGVWEALDREPVFVWESDDDMDGWMTDDQLRAILPDWITLAPDAIAPEEWIDEETMDAAQDRAIDNLARLMERATDDR